MATIAPVTTLSKLVDYFIWFANDVGSYLSNQKLQKLLFYAQAWYLAFEEKPLFDEDFEAELSDNSDARTEVSLLAKNPDPELTEVRVSFCR